MKTFALNDGSTIPGLGLGTWKASDQSAYQAVKEALHVGYRHIDGAWIYGNEEQVGRAIRESIADGVCTRDALFVTTKLWNSFHAPEDVEPACRESLRLLGLEYVDLYLVHWPIAWRKGETLPASDDSFYSEDELPLERTWETMVSLRSAGLARSVGVSNVSPSRLRRLAAASEVLPAVNQVELHPYNPQPELLATCAELGIHLTAYSPLGSRDRPATMRAADEPPLLEANAVGKVAASEDATPAQVLIAWALARGTSVIPKSTNPERIAENFAAASLDLSEQSHAALDAIDTRFRYVAPRSLLRPGVTHEGDFWK